MTSESHEPGGHGAAASGGHAGIELPAPTFWPIVLAAGCTLLGMGVVTNWLFTYIGIGVFLIALAQWLWLLFPGRGHLHEPLAEQRPTIIQAHGSVEHLRPGMAGHRMSLPEKMHPYSAGVKGGIAGGIAMTIPALIYGVLFRGSIWYPINLLAGMVSKLPTLPDGTLDYAQLDSFKLRWLLVGAVIHAVASVSTGLMYGVLLPMLPGRRPIIWGGIVAPLLWTGAIHSFMGVLNPALHTAVHWPSFITAQFVFGLVCGFVVVRSEQVYTDASASAIATGSSEGRA